MLNKIGKIGKLNQIARQKIAEIAEELGLCYCEVQLPGCKSPFGLAPAHRHNREWYRKWPEKLYAYVQWVAACQYCHEILDNRSKMTAERAEEIFMELRGEE